MKSARTTLARSRASWLLALAASAVAACASTTDELTAARESWRGATYDQVLMAWGTPSQSSVDSHTWLSDDSAPRVQGSGGGVGGMIFAGGALRPHARVPRRARGRRALGRRSRVLHALRAPEMNTTYSDTEPKRAEIDQLAGRRRGRVRQPVVRLLPPRAAADRRRPSPRIPGVRHFKIADASGKRLGRSFGVKLWPTLVFLRDGKEVARLVRPRDAKAISEALAQSTNQFGDGALTHFA